jgi:hypothetical protein
VDSSKRLIRKIIKSRRDHNISKQIIDIFTKRRTNFTSVTVTLLRTLQFSIMNLVAVPVSEMEATLAP